MQLTGGQTFNINNGVFASDMLSFPTTANKAALAFKAIFGCALAYIECSQDSTSTSCYKNTTEVGCIGTNADKGRSMQQCIINRICIIGAVACISATLSISILYNNYRL